MVVVLFKHGSAFEFHTVICKITAPEGVADLVSLRTRPPNVQLVVQGDVCILLESTLLFFPSICRLFLSLCNRPMFVPLSMYILLDLKDMTDFEDQSFAFRLRIERAGYISEDIARALFEQSEAFLT
ncbi:unnamed protein product [Angiostrongylus costaricensis]|uniref:BFN domain-containing protein n=1 Tax=Angiostrongylus costaricensis TaxID=334426 RepID=A0A0R3Q2A2_ANGCS|nr:unnamed protein product [Angiostrongylus costaricensis]